MLSFRQIPIVQKFVTVHATVLNHFNQETHFYSRDNFKLKLTIALKE